MWDQQYFSYSLFSDSHVLALDGMVNGPVWTGPTDMVDGHRAYRPSILFLDLECAWQSSGCLQRRFQINYPRSSSIIVCVAAWNQLPRDRGGVMSTHVRTCYVHTCQDCIRIGSFSFLIYDGMRSLFMTACPGSFLP